MDQKEQRSSQRVLGVEPEPIDARVAKAIANRAATEPAKPLFCGACGMLHERIARLTGQAFEAGSLSICLACQKPMRFPSDPDAMFFEMLEPKDLPIEAFREWSHLRDQILKVRRRNPKEFDRLVAGMRNVVPR
jgi:hypothetical protein